MIEDFLRDLDASWRWPDGGKIRLRIIGSAALLLQSDYRRGTKDSDFELKALDIVDVVVSKLKRFSRDDLGDITAMVDPGARFPREAGRALSIRRRYVRLRRARGRLAQDRATPPSG